jgi:hypothetical protein
MLIVGILVIYREMFAHTVHERIGDVVCAVQVRTEIVGVSPERGSQILNSLNPLAPPGRSLEGIREILCLMHDLTVAELHNAHRVCWSPLVGDCVFRDPEITFSENSLDVETRRVARMMTSQGLQIPSTEDSLP